MAKDSSKEISIALSGGGARGFVHLGMIQALHKHGYEIKAIAGASIGALAGCLTAQGIPPADILSLLKKTKISGLLTPKLSLKGFISMDNFIKNYEKLCLVQDLKDTEIPMHVATTNLSMGESKVFSKGPIGTIVAASCCVPGIFQPVEMDNNLFVDGGLTMNLPAEPLLAYPWPIFGLHCNAYPKPAVLQNMRDVLEKSSQLSIYQNTLRSMKHCKAVFEPPEMSAYSSFSFNQAENFFDIGFRFLDAALQ